MSTKMITSEGVRAFLKTPGDKRRTLRHRAPHGGRDACARRACRGVVPASFLFRAILPARGLLASPPLGWDGMERSPGCFRKLPASSGDVVDVLVYNPALLYFLDVAGTFTRQRSAEVKGPGVAGWSIWGVLWLWFSSQALGVTRTAPT